MQIAVASRHIAIPAELRELTVEKVSHLEKYLEGTERAEVLFARDHASRDGDSVCCEVTVIARRRYVRARAFGQVPEAALEIALDKEASRLARMKDRLVHRYRPRHHTPARTDLGPGN